jgi:hypothetical protein
VIARVCLALVLCVGATAAAAQDKPPEKFTAERTAQESDNAIALFGGACRASDDSSWVRVCSAALAQAAIEIRARQAKPAPAPDQVGAP